MFTLSSAVDALESLSQPHGEKDLRWENMQSAMPEPTTHLDGIPRQFNVDELLTQFRPFNAPPPPVPMPEGKIKRSYRKPQTNRADPRDNWEVAPKQKAWTTTIVVTESTFANGAKSWTAETSPMVQVPVTSDMNVEEPSEVHEIKAPQPFLRRMRLRQMRWDNYREWRRGGARERWILISVKRQRKLKMKKHKYKKLMRRTRNLRRRQERN